MNIVATDVFPTKGIEYLLVIGYLVLFYPLWLVLNRRPPTARDAKTTAAATHSSTVDDP